MKDIPPGFFKAMLDDVKLRESDVVERLANALNPDYWRALTRHPSTEAPGHRSSGARPDSDIRAAIADFRRTGVYHVRGAIGPDAIAHLNHTIDAVVGAGWPGVFAFACEELWECARLDPIRKLVAGALGDGARQIPHVWTHTVKPLGEQAGWSPHVDGPGDDRITVWIALTDAGLDNGCMYAIPRDAAVADAIERWHAPGPIEKERVKTLLQGTRAMPAAAGDIVGWAFDIVHWGGHVSRTAAGRRSVSLEFIAAHAEPGPTDVPLVPLSGPLPSHADRLRAVASAILEYEKFEPLLLRHQDVANGILEAMKTRSGA